MFHTYSSEKLYVNNVLFQNHDIVYIFIFPHTRTSPFQIKFYSGLGIGLECFFTLILWGKVFTHCKLQEQIQVRSVHYASTNQISELVLASIFFRDSFSIIVKVEVPSGNTNCSTNEHLYYLRRRDKDRRKPLWNHLEGLQAIVSVHHCVDGVIHTHEIEPRRGVC